MPRCGEQADISGLKKKNKGVAHPLHDLKTNNLIVLRRRIDELQAENNALRREMNLYCTEEMPRSLALSYDASTSTTAYVRQGRVTKPPSHACR